MKQFQSEVIAGETCDALIETLGRYLAAGWRPILDPEYGVFDETNSDGTTSRREQYFQRVIKLA